MKDILSLKLYTRVARLGSFSAAARECGLSQSQVSRIIAELESDLDARLLTRTTRAVVLTDASAEFLSQGTSGKTSVFVSSDDASAKEVVSHLATEMGFDPVNGGALAMALYAEVLGMFAVRLATDSGYGRTISFHAFNAG